MHHPELNTLLSLIEQWSKELGFSAFGISDINLSEERTAYEHWLEKGYNGTMKWLEDNCDKRLDPALLVPGSCRVLSFRLNYLPDTDPAIDNLKVPSRAYISRYALGRDYHKLIRKRLAKLAGKIQEFAEKHTLVDKSAGRVFVDSAPVLERPIAERAGLGWTGKHTLILNQHEGSWFFLGEIFTNIPLPCNEQVAENQCGDCEACMKICPTDAFPEPYILDARRCISYLTIEHDGAIPVEFREPIGNRIFGCDDCQLICPWNKAAPHTEEADFQPRHGFSNIELTALFQWTEQEFLTRTEGSAIRRAGYEKWQRNIAVALGNAPQDIRIIEALEHARTTCSDMVKEHIDWALYRQSHKQRRRRKVKNPEKVPSGPRG